MKNNLLKKFLTYFYGSGIGLIIGVLTTIISTRLLSPEDFGKASMFTLLVSVCMIFVIFGTDQAFVRFYYEEEEQHRGGLLYNSLKIPIILLLFTSIIIVIFKDSLMQYLFGEINDFVFYSILIGIVIQVFYRFSTLVIRMQQKAHIYSLLEILNKLFTLIFILMLYYLIGPSYEILIYSTIFTFFILLFVSIYLEKGFWSREKNVDLKTKHSQKEIFNFSYPLVLTTLITWLFQGFDKIALRQWSTFEELGLYSAAFRIVALLMVIQAVFSTFWTPVCYEHYEKKPNDKQFFSRTSKIISFVMFVMAIVTILFKDIIITLLGPEYKEAAIIMPFLIFMPMMYTISETTVIGINFSKKTKWHIVIAVTACVTNIIGNFLLVPYMGAAGAALSTGVSYIVFFALRTHIAQRYYVINFELKKLYFGIALTSLFALQSMIMPQSSITYIMGVLLLLLVSYLYKNEITFLKSLIKIKRKKV